jgi:hypothetical protein
MAKKILRQIQNVTSYDMIPTLEKEISQLSDIDHAKHLLILLDEVSKKTECGLQKKEVIKGLISLTWVQRVHSTIRSLILGLVAAAFLIPVLLIFGSLNILQNILMFIPIFLSGLIITRYFENQIIKVAKKTVRYLSKHKRLRDFLMKYV